MIFTCEHCGKEFKATPSSNRKYCCRECANKAAKGKPKPKLNKKVEVTCLVCGKKEMVPPCRAKKYKCCSKECLGKYFSESQFKGVDCICPICGKEFRLKQSYFNSIKGIPCCSYECSYKLKEQTFKGENNHQYGLIGELNSSFAGKEIISNLGYILEYCPGHPRPCDNSNKTTRVRQHRLVIERNHEKFDPSYFDEIDGWFVLKPEYDVHHINEIKTDNRLENLQILTRSEHSKLHEGLTKDRLRKYKNIIGVLKQSELLETPEVDNQQPSLSSNTFEGSETSNRILTSRVEDNNIATSALLQQIKDIVEDDIVRTVDITENKTTELKDKEPLG